MSDTSSEIRVTPTVKHQMLNVSIWKKMTRNATLTAAQAELLTCYLI
jgi:hypothetical protein